MLDLDMGKYGFYVWGSYLVTALVLGLAVVLTWAEARKARTRLARLQQVAQDSAKSEGQA